MAVYRVTLVDGSIFLMSGNMEQASAGIQVNWHDTAYDRSGGWQSTPYQTADARHSPYDAAQLVAEYFKSGPDDCEEVEDVEKIDVEKDL